MVSNCDKSSNTFGSRASHFRKVQIILALDQETSHNFGHDLILKRGQIVGIGSLIGIGSALHILHSFHELGAYGVENLQRQYGIIVSLLNVMDANLKNWV